MTSSLPSVCLIRRPSGAKPPQPTEPRPIFSLNVTPRLYKYGGYIHIYQEHPGTTIRQEPRMVSGGLHGLMPVVSPYMYLILTTTDEKQPHPVVIQSDTLPYPPYLSIIDDRDCTRYRYPEKRAILSELILQDKIIMQVEVGKEGMKLFNVEYSS